MLKKSTTDINETNKTIEVVENNQTVDADETNKTIEVVENNQTVDADGTNKTIEVVENNQTVDADEINKTIEVVESNQTIENNITEHMENNIAYRILQDKVEKIERVINISRVNLVVLEEAMPEILDRCSNIDFNTTCFLGENDLEPIVMDNRTSSDLSLIINENNITFPDINNNTVSLGEVSYKKMDDNSSYQYTLSHNMSLKLLEQNISSPYYKRELYYLKWSDNNQDIVTQYIYEDNQTFSKVSIHYLSKEDEKEFMYVSFLKDSNISEEKESINLILTKDMDENGSFTLVSNSIDESTEGNETNKSSFSSNVDISEESTLLQFSGTFLNEQLDSNESNETILKTSTVVEENGTISDLDENTTIDIEDISTNELYELNITGGSIDDGQYLIFAPDNEIIQFTSLEIYELSIGSFTIYDDEIQGELHVSSYEDQLDELIIVKVEESTGMFTIVKQTDRPILKIVE
jgi:hypothetical protein